MLEFLNPWMLLGAGLIAVPIAIHLLSKTRYKIELWGAMMFIRSAIEIRARRIRLEELIMLILRCLFIALIALALARPIANRNKGSLSDPTTHVLVIDNSYSMRQGEEEHSPFKKAQDTALEIVERMNDQDNMLIVLGGVNAEALFPEASFDKKYLTTRIKSLKPGYEQMFDLPKVLMETFWMVEASALPRHRFYILTDGQKYGWGAEEKPRWANLKKYHDSLKIKPGVYVIEHDVGGDMQNFAILDIRSASPIVDVYRPAKFFVEVGNYSGGEENVHVEFYIDGVMRGERDASCAPGKTTLEFDHDFNAAGAVQKTEDSSHSYHYVTARIEEDDLDADNVFSLALEVKHSMKVLVIEGSETEDVWASDAGLLELALSASGKLDGDGLFSVTRKNIYAVESGGFEDIDQYKTVVLANVPFMSKGLQFALERFVDEGGGLFVVLGDKVNGEEYNRLSNNGKGLVPAKLIEIESSDKKPLTPSFPAGSATHILDVFDVSRTRVLNDVKVKKYWITEPAEDAMTLGVLDDNPFLLYRHYGEGRVAVMTTSANIRWNNFPLTQDYLPLLQNIVTYLSASIQPPVNLEPGEMLVYIQPEASSAASTCKVTSPDNEIKELEASARSGRRTMEFAGTQMPGIYTVEIETAPSKYYAVAFKPGEGDLERLSGIEKRAVKKSVVSDFAQDRGGLDTAIKDETGAREWWRRLVFLACLLLCLELYLGRRFST